MAMKYGDLGGFLGFILMTLSVNALAQNGKRAVFDCDGCISGRFPLGVWLSFKCCLYGIDLKD